jgi:hypothetical protein
MCRLIMAVFCAVLIDKHSVLAFPPLKMTSAVEHIADANSPLQARPLVQSRLRDRKSFEADSAFGRRDRSIDLFVAWDKFIHQQYTSKTSDRASRLVGQLEMAIGTELPQQWIDVIEYAKSKSTFPRSIALKPSRIGLSKYYSTNAEITVQKNVLRLARDGRADIELDTSALPKKGYEGIEIVPIPGTKKCLIVLPSYNHAGAYPIFLFDTDSQKTVWEATIWAASKIIFGRSHHSLQLLASQSTCIAIGNDSTDLYIESFDLETGKALIRFNSRHWSDDPAESDK